MQLINIFFKSFNNKDVHNLKKFYHYIKISAQFKIIFIVV